jgi:hypothetical protein
MTDPNDHGQPTGQQPWAQQQPPPDHQQQYPQQYPQQQYQQQQYQQATPAHHPWGAAPAGYPTPAQPSRPASASRPGQVLTAAILAFLLGGLMAIGGIVAIGASRSADSAGGILGVSGLGGVVVAVGLVFLLLAALMIWGGIWAVMGKSYLLLLITACVFGVLSLISLIQTLSNGGNPAAGILGMVICAVIVVLLASQPSRNWFAEQKR